MRLEYWNVANDRWTGIDKDRAPSSVQQCTLFSVTTVFTFKFGE